jgi:hypothetical protein
MAQPQAEQAQTQSATNTVIAVAAAAELASLWPSIDLTAPGALAMVQLAYYAVAAKWGLAAATSAAEHYDQVRAGHRIRGLFRATPSDPIAQDITDKAVASAFQADPNAVDTTSALPVQERVPARLNDSITRHVLQPARDTIVDNGAKDPAKPKGWARVATSDKPCAFCVLMASRTHLYRGKKSGGDMRLLADEQRYHKGCSCIAVPVFNTPPPSQQGHREMYEKASANAGTTSDPKKILATMRQLYNLK